MKKISLLAAVIVSVFILVGASVWEGAAGIGEGLPENGFYLATNSFPVNTIVEVVNLENNKSANFIVSSSLENSGFLALLSKDAADYIGLKDSGRIRMKETDDQIVYSGLGERRFFSGDPNYESERIDLDEYDLAMIPAETRPPMDWNEPDPVDFISPIPKVNETPIITVIPSDTQPAAQFRDSESSTTVFLSDYLIPNFIKGMYYVQIGAYKTVKTVESEILKVEKNDKNLPVAIMKIGSQNEPIYRVLIGPLNLGEGGAVLQRYKASYKDAFLRVEK